MISSLNRKLLRDVWAMKGQALAVALVVAGGVSMYVSYLSTFDSLLRTQEAYYGEQRFGDVFATLERAPMGLESRIADISGVTALEMRVVAGVTLDIEGFDEPATGQLLSVPSNRRPEVNDLFLRAGRWIDSTRPDEVLVSEGFFDAHAFELGDQIMAVINGRRRALTMVGVVLSPEFVYTIPPGDLLPDDRRFGVLWMDQRALASAYDMAGGFNSVSLALAPNASEPEAIAQLDRLLEPYGGLGAIPRALQISHWTLANELRMLQTFGVMIPVVFLLVAAVILNVALTRALALQRPQIAALKALGYGNTAIGWHYVKWALVISLGGVILGVFAGWGLGNWTIQLYNEYFRFPVLLFGTPPSVVLEATALTLVAAGAGAFSAVRRAVSIPPAEAMRPEAPGLYHQSHLEGLPIVRHASMGTRMVLRNLLRHPFRATASVLGIGFAVAILVMAFSFLDAMDTLLEIQFWTAERQNVTVSFISPRSADAQYALQRLPGVLRVEPQRSVAVRMRAGHRERTLAITGVSDTARLRQIVDRNGTVFEPPAFGLMVSQILADVLALEVGDRVQVEVLEGARPAREFVVTTLVDDLLGLSAYVPMTDLHEFMRESDVVTGALLLVDPAREAELSRRLKLLPAVAGTAYKQAMIASFRDIIAANTNLMLTINLLFAGVIAFGVVYNSARVSLSERSRELASLRVLGFTRAEISLILLGELWAVTLAALPVGALMGYLLAAAVIGMVDSEVYRFPVVLSRQAIALSSLAVVAAAIASGLLVRRQLDRLDLVAVLKIRE